MKYSDEHIANIIEHSYKDFHAKGLDYICLHRSNGYTLKLYFFNGNLSQLPEVVNPHDHRYNFTTTVLAGQISNIVFRRAPGTDTVPDWRSKFYQEFEYLTPLNGGSGFTWKREVILKTWATGSYETEESYYLDADDFHTINIEKEGTIIQITQFEDVIPVDQPTLTFTQSKEPPGLSGLYTKFTPDEIVTYLNKLSQLKP